MNWIKMRSNLWNDPRVTKICDITNKPEREVIGCLYWLWAMADDQSVDGRLDGFSLTAIDRKTGFKGFAAALVKVGWLLEDEEGVEIARFDEHNGASAKRRASEAKRMQFVRKPKENCSQPMRTESEQHAQLDKNRIDISPIVPNGDMILEVEECPKPEEPHPHLSRLRALFRLQPSTPLDSSATRAWEKNKKSAAALTEEDWRALEWAYRQKDGTAFQFRRKDLSTLLNNILAEVTRARQWAASVGASLRDPAASPYAEPPGWRDCVETNYPECNISTWAALPDSMKTFVREHLKTQTAA
jgi:hypothetical protein